MPRPDAFELLARYYDPIMDHVNYDRWFMVSSGLAAHLPRGFMHADLACGTGVLLNMARVSGWNSVGIDISPGMLRAARRQRGKLPVAAADLRVLPFGPCFDLITCLFDSLNFLLDERDLFAAFCEMRAALKPGGIIYCDVVTEQMVKKHYKDQAWTEQNGRFSTTWSSTYDRKTAVAETSIRVNTGVESMIRERMYPLATIEQAIAAAGLRLVDMRDADTGKGVKRKTTRVDIFACAEEAEVWARRVADIFR